MSDGAHSDDPLSDGPSVDLFPHQRVNISLVNVVSVDLGAAAVFGSLPGKGYGGAITVQHGHAIGSTWSCWITRIRDLINIHTEYPISKKNIPVTLLSQDLFSLPTRT